MSNGIMFKALADDTRRGIFEALRGDPLSVSELSHGQTVSRPAVSQHLKVLQDAGLVSVRPEGTRRMYAIRREGLNALRMYLDSYWSDALSAYSEEINRQLGDENAGTRNKDH